MAREIVGNLVVGQQRFALLVSRFNDFITARLVEGAVDAIVRHGGSEERITIVRVPGAWELPVTARKLAETGRFDAIVCLGCVIRGQTPHFDFVAGESAKGIAQVALQTGVPVSFGVVTADSLEQAIERAGAKQGNKGADAALSAIELVNLFAQLPRATADAR